MLLTCVKRTQPACALLLVRRHVVLYQPLVAAATELLLRGARERCSRVVLTWPYGGLVAEVSGELVGGWGERMAMTRCLSSQGCMGAGRGEGRHVCMRVCACAHIANQYCHLTI